MERQRGGPNCVVYPRKSMTEVEAQSAPPSVPVEDEPQPERKVIGRESVLKAWQVSRLNLFDKRSCFSIATSALYIELLT